MARAVTAPGAPLDVHTRAQMESSLGHDFSRVRVHTDAQAAESARAVDAAAYTVGRDIVFGAGRYAPSSRAGQHLLAHELTHVAQQAGASGPAEALNVDGEEAAEERHADAAAHAVAEGHAPPTRAGRTSAVRVQRQNAPQTPTGGSPAGTQPDRFPTAPNAWHGIELYQVVEPELKPLGTVWATKKHIRAGVYEIVPVLANGPVLQVVYYGAYNTVSKRHEFAIGPDDLDTFIARAEKFEDVAALALPWGVTRDARGELVGPELSPWQVELARMGRGAAQGDMRGVVEGYGEYTKAAVQDPGWWMMTGFGISMGLGPGAGPRPAAPRIPEVAALETPKAAGDAVPTGTAAPRSTATSTSKSAKGGAKPSGGTPIPDEAKTDPGMTGHESAVTPQQLDKIAADAVANPLVKRMRALNQAEQTGALKGEALTKEVRKTLKDFEQQTGVKVVEVENGKLSGTKPEEWGTRQAGYNYASLRAKPGSMLIEKQVFTDATWLLGEVTHEFASFFTGGGVIFAHLEGVEAAWGTALWGVEKYMRGED